MDTAILTLSLLTQYSNLLLNCSGSRFRKITQAPVLKDAMVTIKPLNISGKEHWNKNYSGFYMVLIDREIETFAGIWFVCYFSMELGIYQW